MKILKLIKNQLKGNFIKIKIKYILTALAIIFIVIPNLIIAIAYTVFDMNWFVTDKSIPVSYFTQGALNLYVKIPKISPFEDLAYYIMGKNYYNTKEAIINIGVDGGNYGSSFYNSKDGIKNAIKYHEKAIEDKKESKYYLKNVVALINLYTIEGEQEKVEEKINLLKNSKDLAIKDFGILNEAIYLTKRNKYNEALATLDKIDEKYEMAFNLDNKKAIIYMISGDEKKAIEYFYKENYNREKIKEAVKEVKNIPTNEIDFIKTNFYYKDRFNIDYYEKYGSESEKKSVENYNNIIKNNILDEKYRGDFKGSLKLNNQSMEGTLIILSKYGGLYNNKRPLDVYNNIYGISYVDENGEFYLENLPEGEYYINAVIPYNKMKNIEINPSVMFFQHSKIEIKATKDLEKGKKYNEKNFTWSTVGDRNYIVDEDLLKEDEKNNDNEIILDETDEEYVVDKVEEEYKEIIKIEELENEIKYTNVKGDYSYVGYYGYCDSLLKYFTEGESINLSKNFIDNNGYPSFEKEFTKEIELVDPQGFIYLFGYGIAPEIEGTKKIKINYNEIEKEFIKTGNYKALFDYYNKEYKTGNKDINIIERLIKLYTLGYNSIGEGKDINKAMELNKELNKIRGEESIYLQIKNYILKNQREVLEINISE